MQLERKHQRLEISDPTTAKHGYPSESLKR